MIAHYLKVALRNLLKYKTHSLISALCLAVGITAFSLMYFFIHQLESDSDLPHYEKRIGLTLSSDQVAADTYFYAGDIEHLEEAHIEELDSLSAVSYQQMAEVNVIDKEQQEKPFIISYRCASPFFFSYYDMQLIHGNRIPQTPDEVVISKEFAHKIGAGENPVGITIHIVSARGRADNLIKDFKVINVVEDTKKNLRVDADCYFALEANPWTPLMVGSFIKENMNLSKLQKRLETITWKREEATLRPSAFSIAERESEKGRVLSEIMALLVISLILLSGLINFLKFIIQMFYNRQHELALRKCVGSDTKGLFMLLFCEVFWMMSFSLLLSMLLTEIVTSIAVVYIPQKDMIAFPLLKIYLMQFIVYIALLAVCLGVISIPVRKLRDISIINYVAKRSNRHHRFRNTMIAVQLGISIFFLGGVFIISLSFNELFERMYNPLAPEEESQIIALNVNSQRMRENLDAINADISELPDVTDKISLCMSANMNTYTYMTYKKADGSEGMLSMTTGDPHYFSFFKIPMQGKETSTEATGDVYISEEFQEQLNKDNVQGMVELDGKSYRIVGVYKGFYKEFKREKTIGSIFMPNAFANAYYFKISPTGDVEEHIQKITDICRKYIPYTLPVSVQALDDTKQSTIGSIEMMRGALSILAVVSLLLVILSVYSAISMDTISRQKEVAIRKINGATPSVIAKIFGKPYLIIFLLTFIIVFPLLRLIMIKTLGNAGVECVYGWSWGILLFAGIAVLLLLITSYKIYKIMHINPAKIMKNEG